jgi:hypothetical protein
VWNDSVLLNWFKGKAKLLTLGQSKTLFLVIAMWIVNLWFIAIWFCISSTRGASVVVFRLGAKR